MVNEEKHLLVVDDDDRLRELIKNYLVKYGYFVSSAADAAQARLALKEFNFDLIVLDVMMPNEDGLSLMASIRKFSMIPILLLTAMAEGENRINGFIGGADDYVTKPFEPKELLLRIDAILRRVQPQTTPQDKAPIYFGEFQFDFASDILKDANDVPIFLTSSHLALLRTLLQNAGKVISREVLAYESNIKGGDRAIDVQIARLRQKIEVDPKQPRYICTVHGQGYVFKL